MVEDNRPEEVKEWDTKTVQKVTVSFEYPDPIGKYDVMGLQVVLSETIQNIVDERTKDGPLEGKIKIWWDWE